MECRCTTADMLYGTDAEAYAADHLVSANGSLTCPDTGARWRVEERGPQLVLRQVEPERHLTRRPQH